MKYFILSLLLVLGCELTAQIFEPAIGPDMTHFVRESTAYRIKHGAVQQLQQSRPATLELPIGPITLNLHQVEIFSPQYRIRTETQVIPGRGDMLFYRGQVTNDPKSFAAVSIIDSSIHAMFSFQEEVYRIHRVGKWYLLYKDADVVKVDTFICAVTAEHVLQQTQLALLGNCVEIYFECDFKSYQDNGSSVPNTEAWVAELFNEVATLYENEDIPVMISDIKVWTTTDPYAGLNSTSMMLNEFVQQTSQNGYEGRLAHLLSTRQLGGGIAYVNVLCHPTLACGVSTSLSTNIIPFPSYSWSVECVTHELGHNFGSRHTHDCVWNGNNTQIDDCGSVAGDVQPCYNPNNPIIPNDGTIMSYCHLISGAGINFSLGFGPQPGALILTKYLTAPCVTGCGIVGIGIEEFKAITEDCVVYLSWVTNSTPVLSESDGITWQTVPIGGNAYTDRSPSKYYRLECEGDVRILINNDLCEPPYQVVGSTLIINTGGDYRIATVDGRVIIDRELPPTQLKLWTGAWIVTFNGKSEIVVVN